MRPIQPGDLVTTPDGYYAIVRDLRGREPGQALVLCANGLNMDFPLEGLTPLPMRVGFEGDAPASFVEMASGLFVLGSIPGRVRRG